MKPIQNFENVKPTVEREQLPKGGYIVTIKNAEVKTYGTAPDTFEKLEISIDIAEGEYKDFYANDYRAQQSEDKRWKGVLRQYLPKEDGSEKDEWTKSAFKALICALEDSNPGFHWDWDEGKLKGLKAGCLFRFEEWEFNGSTGWISRPFKFIAADRIHTGKFKVPNDKPLKKDSSAPSGFAPLDIAVDDDLPF